MEEFFGENFLGRIFWGEFFGRIFLGEFFGRNYLVEINEELMFLSRFWDNARRRKDKNLDPKKCEASSSHLKISLNFDCSYQIQPKFYEQYRVTKRA